jgi:hypothetical protein
MTFRITGLPLETFQPLFGLDDEALAARGVIRMPVDAKPGFPCRISLADAEIGDTVLLLNHEYQSGDTPYRASHAIFVNESAARTQTFVDEVPDVLRLRTISLRAFDEGHMMIDADLAEGEAVEVVIRRMLANPDVAYLQAHNARRGCYAARVERG